jgi:hypothetical protein
VTTAPVGSAFFAGSGSISTSIKSKIKQNFLPENYNFNVQNIENYDNFDTDKKDKTM